MPYRQRVAIILSRGRSGMQIRGAIRLLIRSSDVKKEWCTRRRLPGADRRPIERMLNRSQRIIPRTAMKMDRVARIEKGYWHDGLSVTSVRCSEALLMRPLSGL